MNRFLFSSILCMALIGLFSSLVVAQMIPQIGHQETIVHAEISPDGKWLATGGRDRVILLWDMRTGLHWTLAGHAFVVTGIDFDRNSKLLATSDGRGKIMIWDVATRKVLYSKDLQADVGDIHFIPNHNEITYAVDEKLYKWDFTTNQMQALNATITASKSSASLSPDGKFRVATEKNMNYTNGKFVTTYTAETFNLELNMKSYQPSLIKNGNNWEQNFISASGKLLALANENTVVIQDFTSSTLVRKFNHTGGINKLYISKDDKQVVFSSGDGLVNIGNIATGTIKKVASLSSDEIPGGLIAYDGVNKIVGVDNRDLKISTYDINADLVVNRFKPVSGVAQKLVWNQNNRQLFVDYKSLTGEYAYEPTKGLSTVVWDMNGLNVNKQTPYVHLAEGSFTNVTSDFDYELKSSKTRKYRLARSSNPEILNIYMGNAETPTKLLTMNGTVTGQAMSLDDTKLFVSTIDEVAIYKFPSLELIKRFLYEVGAPFDITLSRDGKYFGVGKTSETVLFGDSEKPLEFDVDIYNTSTLTLHKKLKGHYSTITDLEFTPDGKLFTSAYDGTIRLWDYEKGEQLALLHGMSPEYFFILSSNGYYTVSKEAIDRVAFATTSAIYPAAQFEIKLNRPDKVAEIVGYSDPTLQAAYLKAYQKRISKMGISEEKLDLNNLPQITITNQLPLTTDKKLVMIEMEAFDAKAQLTDLQVMINNVPIVQPKITAKSGKPFVKKLELELSSGKNTISLSVINEQGLASAPATVVLTCTQKVKPSLYLLAIGVSKFADSSYNLTYASKDADDLTRFFQSKKNDYQAVHVKDFINYSATRDNILAANDFFSGAAVDDDVIIFVASHGLLDNQMDYYLATTDMVFDKPSFRGLKYEDLENMITNSKARNRLIMIDACHSGEVDKESTVTASSANAKGLNNATIKNRGFKTVKSTSGDLGLKNSFELMKDLFSDMRGGTGATVISSAAGTEFALESDAWKNGVFTYAVLNGLNSKAADANRDENISVNELKSYVFAEVELLTQGKQHPTSRVKNLQNDFVLATTAESKVAKINPAGIWVLNYNYYGDTRQRYMEIFSVGADLDVYMEGMEDYSKAWSRGSRAIRFQKAEPNIYRDGTGGVLEFKASSEVVYDYGYGGASYKKTDKIVKP